VILNFAQECYYLENKVGVVDFTKARGLVKFQSLRALAGPWALKHYHSLGISKIYYSHFLFEVMYHFHQKIYKLSKTKSCDSGFRIYFLTNKLWPSVIDLSSCFISFMPFCKSFLVGSGFNSVAPIDKALPTMSPTMPTPGTKGGI
jgi:hypothetical protein